MHLLLECNLADPFLEMDQRNIKPSLIVPSEQSHRESGEKATDRMPKLLCSVSVLSGMSNDALSALLSVSASVTAPSGKR